MKKFLQKLLFVLLWPIVFMYAPLRVRSRIMVIANGKFLGVKHHFGNNKWSLPGGGVKRHESYKDAAIRELREELGITVLPRDAYELLGLKTYKEGGHYMRYVIFVVTLQGEVSTANNHEISEVAWLTPDDIGFSRHVSQAVQQATGQVHLLK